MSVGPAGFTRGQVLALLGFVVFAFLLLAWRSEVNADSIRANTARVEEQSRQADRVSCLRGQDILTQINAQTAALAANDQEYLDATIAAGVANERIVKVLTERIAIYTLVPVLDCDP